MNVTKLILNFLTSGEILIDLKTKESQNSGLIV